MKTVIPHYPLQSLKTVIPPYPLQSLKEVSPPPYPLQSLKTFTPPPHTHTPSYPLLLEGLKELHNVGSRPDVDEQELGELVVCEFPLGQEPAAEDEDEQQKLLQGPDPLVGVQVHLDLELDLEWVPGGVGGGGRINNNCVK